MKSEVKVGIFVFIAMLALFFLTTQVGSFKNYSKEGYNVYTDLSNAAGLEKNSKVKANGVEIGYIEKLEIEGDHVKAKLFLNDGVKLPSDSILQATQESMLGGKYLGVTLGKSQDILEAGKAIKSTKSYASINKASDSMMVAANEFKSLIAEFRESFDGDARHSLRQTFINLESITEQLKSFTALNRLNESADNFNEMAKSLTHTADNFSQTSQIINQKLPKILNNLDSLVRDLKVASVQVKEKIPALADQFTLMSQDIQDLIDQNKKPLGAAIGSADSFFAKGEDAFAKVDDLLNSIDKVQLEVAMRGEWMAEDSYSKGFLSLNYKPSDTKSYQFDIAGMQDYSRLDKKELLIEPKTHEKTNLLISAQIAKRFNNVSLRAGLIENTFGAGMDYYWFKDNLKTSAELFDINAENDVRGEKPHAKVSARYTILKHLDIYGGADNFLNKNTNNLFLGMGVRFYDDDLKTLIMSQGLGSMAK
jgi:phospholipid/cholesterol/gamma-HCH transport system substrate-binding protein